MKTTFKISVIVLLAAFYGCQNDLSSGVNSSITSDGVFSGTIVNDSNRIDSIKVYSDIIIGKGAVSSVGKFSVALTTPVLRKIGSAPSGVIVSDTTAMVVSVYDLEAYKGGINTGYIYKSNSITSSLSSTVKAGVSSSMLMYSDRTFTIKGQEVHSSTYNGITSNQKANYSVTLKKGWNELVAKIDSYSKTSTTETTVETLSNEVTTDLQWRYSPSSAYYVRAKTRGVQNVTGQGFLFR